MNWPCYNWQGSLKQQILGITGCPHVSRALNGIDILDLTGFCKVQPIFGAAWVVCRCSWQRAPEDGDRKCRCGWRNPFFSGTALPKQ